MWNTGDIASILTSGPNKGNYYGIIATSHYSLTLNPDVYQKLKDYARLFHVGIAVLYVLATKCQ